MSTLLVTGASAGIGAACARMGAAREYDRIIINYRKDEAGAKDVANDVRAAGAEALTIRADVSDISAVEAMFREIAQHDTGPLHLINNAGIVGPSGTIADLTPARVRDLFSINVLGLIEVTRQAVAHMRAQNGGHIVNISSLAARLGAPGEYIDYAATKGAVDSFTLGLASELGPEGIRVNAVRPGLIETAIHAKGGEPGRLERLGKTPPLGRPGTPEEVAATVLWLLSDEASYVTRTIMETGGGR